MAFPAILAGGLATAIVAGLASGVAQLVLKVVATLGIGYIAYSGADALAQQSLTQILSLLSGQSATTVALVGVLKVGTCLNIMFSAMAMRLSVFGISEGMKRWTITPNAGG